MSRPDEEGGGPDGFLVPARRHRVEETIRGSRFITTVERTGSVEVARVFVQEMSQEFADATHNCWAYVAGPPGQTATIGLSDDGEPHGTAGRPMLETLLHSGVGEICAVTTRYYGGTKLGRGGLGRAYAGGVKLALESLPLARKVERIRVKIQLDYPAVDALFRVLEEVGAVREGAEYGRRVEVLVAIPSHRLAHVQEEVAELTSGQGSVLPLQEEE